MDAVQIQKIGTSVAKTMLCDLDDIFVGDRLRPLDQNKVKELMDSITKVGLLHPISVRVVDKMEIDGESYNVVPILIEGLHRRAALRGLGIKTATCRVLDVDEVGAELIEIAENLHRNDLNKLQRDEQLARWIELTEKTAVSAQTAPKLSARGRSSEGRPEGGINAASRELGVERTDAQRAIKVASLSEEAKDAARETGLDNNRTALLEAAKAPKEEQATVIRGIAEKKSADRLKVDGDVRNETARQFASRLAEKFTTEEWPWVKSCLYETGAKILADAFVNEVGSLVGKPIMDRRYGS